MCRRKCYWGDSDQNTQPENSCGTLSIILADDATKGRGYGIEGFLPIIGIRLMQIRRGRGSPDELAIIDKEERK
jgi:hypothetical protein